MEQIIIAMIYLYPGALVDILRRAFFKRTYCDEETSDGARTAKHFVYSTIISVFSLLIYGLLIGQRVATFEDIRTALSSMTGILLFLGVSLAMTAAFAVGLEALEEGYAKLQSIKTDQEENRKICRSVDSWHTLVYGKEFEETRSALALRIRKGEKEQIGICYSLPGTFEEGIILFRTEETEKALKKNEADALLFGPVAVYYDTKTETFVEFYNAAKLIEKINEKDKKDSLV